MHWRSFCVRSLAVAAMILLPTMLWSTEISETELARLEQIFVQLETENELQRQALNEALDSWLRADQSFRAYESAAMAAIRAVREERDAARSWALAGWVGTAIAAGVAVLAVLR